MQKYTALTSSGLVEYLLLIFLNTTALKNIKKSLNALCYTTMRKFWQGVVEMPEKFLKLIFSYELEEDE